MTRAVALALVLWALPVEGEAACPQGEFPCSKSEGGCRKLREVEVLAIREEGYRAAFELGFLRFSAGEVPLQKIAPDVQILREAHRLLVVEYNACTWTDEEYRERLDGLRQYDREVQELARLGAEDLRRAQAATAESLADDKKHVRSLASKLKSLAADTVTLRKELAEARERVAALDPEKVAAGVREDLRREQEAIRGEVARVRARQEDLEAWGRALETSLGARVDRIDRELLAMRSEIDRISASNARGELESRRYLLTLQVAEGWLGGGLRPSAGLALETMGPGRGPLAGVSFALEVGGAWWKERPSFALLPGAAPATYERNDSFLFANAWGRKYFLSRGAARFYAALGTGALSQGEYGWGDLGLAVHAGAGVLLYPASWRTGIELRVSALETRSKELRFDPFGSAQTDERQRFRTAVTLGLFVTPRAW